MPHIWVNLRKSGTATGTAAADAATAGCGPSLPKERCRIERPNGCIVLCVDATPAEIKAIEQLPNFKKRGDVAEP